MRNKRFNIALIFMVGLLLNTKQASAENYIECYNCSATDIKWAADAWARKNVSQLEADRRITKDVHIIDLYNRSITSYKVTLKTQARLPPAQPFPTVYVPQSNLISTPAHLAAEINDVERVVKDIKKKAESLTIPTSIISNAWESINCSYCENQIDDYVNQQLEGKINKAQLVIKRVAIMFGLINTGTPDIYIIPLGSGGKVFIKVKLLKDPAQIALNVIKYIDADNNTVPATAQQLKNARVRVTNPNHANTINSYINIFSFYIPLRTGTATITDCPLGPDGITPECPIDKGTQ